MSKLPFKSARSNSLNPLLFLTFAVALVAVVPASLVVRDSLEHNRPAGALRGPATTMVESMIDGYQKSALYIGAALAFLSFRKLVPVIWPLFQSSLAGLLIAAELAAVFWLVYGGMAKIGMPRLFWAPQGWTTLQSAVGVTLFIYWMLYLVFVRDFEVHSHEPDRQVWSRFRLVLEESGLPALFRQSLDHVDGATQIRWLLAYTGLPALLAMAIPALLPAIRPVENAALVEWPWLGGMAIGVATVALACWTRVATRLHELWRQLLSRRFDLRHIRDLDPNRLDPHANIKNILVIVVMLQIVSHLDFYFVERWMMSLFPPAFSICVMLGVVATFATYLGTRSRTTRAVVVCALLFVLAVAGMLDYEVEISSLGDWYPTPGQQIVRQIVPTRGARYPGSRVTDLEVFQRATSSVTSRESHEAREKLLDRWATSFETSGQAPLRARKPVLVVVATSGGALRAAVWTEIVLGYLDARLDDFQHHVRLITGASGGMLGDSAYVTARCYGKQMPDEMANLGPPPDYLTPIAWQIAFRDFFPNCLIPWPTHNRGDALEEAWIEHDPAIAHTFNDIRPSEEAGLIPSLVFSPMLVEDGRRVLISNLPLHDLAVIDGEALLTEECEALRERLCRQDLTIAHNGDARFLRSGVPGAGFGAGRRVLPALR